MILYACHRGGSLRQLRWPESSSFLLVLYTSRLYIAVIGHAESVLSWLFFGIREVIRFPVVTKIDSLMCHPNLRLQFT